MNCVSSSPQTAERQTPEGSVSLETSSINQSRTTQVNQPPDCDSSHTQLLGIRSDGPLTESVSGPVAPPASEPDQNKPQNGTIQGRPSVLTAVLQPK